MKLDLITNKAEKQGEVNPNDEFYTPNYAMGYSYASATEGVGRNEAQEDFKKYRDEMLVEFQKRNGC